jgi:hypothetical protein
MHETGSSPSVRSTCSAARPRSGERTPIHTVIPSCPNLRAVAKPTPLFAPVIKAFAMTDLEFFVFHARSQCEQQFRIGG